MRLLGVSLTLMLALGWCHVVSAQQLQRDYHLDVAQEPRSLDASQQASMYEDIEILCRILDRALVPSGTSFWQRTHTANPYSDLWFNWPADQSQPNVQWGFPSQSRDTSNRLGAGINSTWLREAQLGDLNNTGLGQWNQIQPYVDPQPFKNVWPGPAAPHAEGVYLPGYGVVISLTLPPEIRRPQPSQPRSQPASEWDQIRDQLHGKTAKPAAQPQAPAQPTVADKILRVLADNGHHFSQLPGNERLTVVVTFRRGLRSDVPLAIYGQPVGQAQKRDLKRATAQVGQAKGQPRKDSEIVIDALNAAQLSPDKTAEDYELLGELHLKQGHPADAAEAYQQAANRSHDPRQAAALYLKAASIQARLLQHAKQAEHLTEQARKALGQLAPPQAQATFKNTSKPDTRAALPGKLIVSATRAQCDAVAGGKLSFDALKKAAHVQRIEPRP